MVDDAALKQLAYYWFRARLMHDLLHSIKDYHQGNTQAIWDAEEGWEFDTFLCHWLSALFAVVEGFHKLKLKDKRVQRLFNEHMAYLKAMRHATYHFMVKEGPEISKMIKSLNWAEDLHDAIGEFIKELVDERAATELAEKKPKRRRRISSRTP
ncbi:hypothetical protein CV770_18375 [Bradyrhizobium sp. AC87j1]|uniref:hypothetical protein n=1 Tax=Bradyrhizobium sp. AC87j1 TaxID=2055894 RepID=UPI000CEBE15F|nr:hypothetical protein [Bradyrhizobium sp. AC87j1]PPQ17934.1 hypothetical protein CV770_18375 [Bradyrhizobium sp. AC87j1]